MKTKTLLGTILVIVCILSFSCDLLRISPFEVVSWTPGTGYHTDVQNISISFRFSHDPDKVSVERSLSVTADGSAVHGDLFWNGKKVKFVPFTPLEKNKEYVLTILADASDTEGLSMDKNFEVSGSGTID